MLAKKRIDKEMLNTQTDPLQNERENHIANRSRLYSLLAESYRYPDEAFRTQARQGDMAGALGIVLCHLPYPFSWIGEEKKALTLLNQVKDEDIEVEFIRLFESGPGSPPCPLIEGAYRGDRRTVMRELILFYNHFGLSYAEGAQDERPDHLCLEMEFLHYLTFKELLAIQKGSDPSSYLRAQRDFLVRHPLNWVGKVAERMDRIKESLTGDARREVILFYRGLTKLTHRYLQEDCRYLQAMLAH
jgi:DMSO reductase family type II enzyme chaperone